MPEMDFSAMTPPMAAAYRSLVSKFPMLKIAAIRANPALRGAGINGQYVGDGVIEIDPDITDPAQLESLLLHELAHAGGRNEAQANFAEFNQPASAHGAFRPKANSGQMPQTLGALMLGSMKRRKQ